MPTGRLPHITSRIRQRLAALLAVPATALTAFLAYVTFDMATTTYVGYEVELTRSFAIATALVAILAWIGVVALHRSARRHLQTAPTES